MVGIGGGLFFGSVPMDICVHCRCVLCKMFSVDSFFLHVKRSVVVTVLVVLFLLFLLFFFRFFHLFFILLH